MAHVVSLFGRHRHALELRVGVDGEAVQQASFAVPGVHVAVLARRHDLEFAVVKEVADGERRDDRFVRLRDFTRRPRRVGEVVEGVFRIHPSRQPGVHGPAPRFAAVRTVCVHRSVGARDEHVEAVAALDVSERGGGLDRGVEVFVQRLHFARVVAQLEHAPVLAEAPGGVGDLDAYADVVALDREAVGGGRLVGARPECFGDLAEVDRPAHALRGRAGAEGDGFEFVVGGLDAGGVLQLPFIRRRALRGHGGREIDAGLLRGVDLVVPFRRRDVRGRRDVAFVDRFHRLVEVGAPVAVLDVPLRAREAREAGRAGGRFDRARRRARDLEDLVGVERF